MHTLFTAFAGRMAVILVASFVCALPEILAPIAKQAWRTRLRSLVFWALHIIGSVCVLVPASAVLNRLGLRQLFAFDFSHATESHSIGLVIAGYVLLPLLPVLIFDFFGYWYHRLQHAVPFLWRFHSVHHAIEDLNGTNCYHHPLEELLRFPFVMLPLALLIRLDVPTVAIYTAFFAISDQLIHINADVTLGPFYRVFVSPRFHRIHHSVSPQHRDRNFATRFPIWDVLFGTAYWPKDEKITTGIDDRYATETVREFLLARGKPRA